MMLNVRGGSWFVEQPYESQRVAFQDWLARAVQGGRLLVIEVGAGFNTPTVIRWPCEWITARNANARLIRINLHHPELRFPVAERATVVALSAADVLSALSARA